MNTSTIWAKSELPNPSGRPTNAPKTFPKIRRLQPTSIDLHPTPSFTIQNLGSFLRDFRSRSGKMGQGREGVFGRPDGFGSSDFAQIVDLFMLYRSTWVSGADFIKIMDCLAEDGSTFDDLSSETIG